MVFGLLKDIKEGENRVICTPVEIKSIVAAGHKVLCQRGCGKAAGFSDEEYVGVGAEMVDTMEEMYARCDFLAKVKEISAAEYGLLREGQIVYCCVHPAAHPEEVEALLEKKVISFSAEDNRRYGSPNCEAAGKVGALMGVNSLLTTGGGKGKWVGGFAGAPGVNAIIMGCGVVGQAALSVLYALGANVTVMDINPMLLRNIQTQYGQHINTMYCTQETVASLLPQTELVINSVKWPKERKDFLITREMLKTMPENSVIVDVSNDDPGAVESSHETHYDDPYYFVNGVLHYCVSNLPAAAPLSTSVALGVVELPAILSILNNGVAEACARDGFLRRSLTTYNGYLTHEETSAIQNRPWVRPEDILGISDRALDPAPPATTTRSNNFIKL